MAENAKDQVELKEEEATEDSLFESVTKEYLDEYATQMEEARKVLTPPEGKILLGMRSVCPIHGDITQASKFLTHTQFVKNPEGKIVSVTNSDVICVKCLSDLWRKYIKENFPKDENGNTRVISVSPIFGDAPEKGNPEDKAPEAKPETKKEVVEGPAEV